MKFIKWAGIVILTILLGIIIILFSAHEKLPEGAAGPEAEALADKVLIALNKPAYDSLSTLTWSFPRGHHFKWDKKRNVVNVRWSDYEVEFSPNTMQGEASKNGQLITGEEKDNAIRQAWALFANDSFWLVAPYKIRDPGTTRKVVELENGFQGLLITYSSGGVTPGDSYLWILDDNYRPKAWKMWVKIIPIGGLEFSWEGWEEHGNAWFAPIHKAFGPISVDLNNLEIY